MMRQAVVITLLSSSLHAGWYDRKAEGWHWYEDPARKTEKKETSAPIQPLPAKEQLSKMREELEEKLAEAILNPTEKNLYAYMELQKQLVEKSSIFAHNWSRLLLAHPDLDATITGRPVSRYGIQIHDKQRNDNLKKLINDLAKDHLLCFFYEGSSKVSQAQAKILVDYSKLTGLRIIPMCVDGYYLENLPDSKPGTEMAVNLGVSHFPAVYMLNPKTEVITPIAFGITAMDTLGRNIELQFEEGSLK